MIKKLKELFTKFRKSIGLLSDDEWNDADKKFQKLVNARLSQKRIEALEPILLSRVILAELKKISAKLNV